MPVRVLIVDDDTRFRQLIGGVLADRGYEIVGEAGTLEDASNAIAELAPDALLLDINLPDGNGLKFATELASGLRILLTSTDPEAAPARLLEASGAQGFVVKTDLFDADLESLLG